MRQRLLSHLTYANVMVTILAFIVLGGMSYAATGGNFILGKSNSASTPTALSSGASQALKVTNSTAHTGVWASGGSVANNAAAVHGQSTNGNAVEGISGKNTASGVYGQNDSTGFGVAGRSPNGVGVMGDSSGGWAMQAFGNAKQTRAGNGFVKAMAYVDPQGHPSDPIQQCFNSQRQASQATNGNCGISYTPQTTGHSRVNFGFDVTDRVASVTAAVATVITTAVPEATSGGEFEVETFDVGPSHYETVPFYIVVY
jgi:hypothetical protein